MPNRLILLLILATLLMLADSAAGDAWYEHYASAEQALDDEDWALAVDQLNEALARKADSGSRVRSYGMNVVAYFPYFKLGVAYYHLGQFDAAMQAFETETRLGAIGEINADNAELERYSELATTAQAAAEAEQQQRIRQIVRENLADAERLDSEGQPAEAMEAVDRALAVAPDDATALSVMQSLRRQFAEGQRQRDEAIRITRLVDDGKSLLADQRFSEASSLFRQALALRPDQDVEELLEGAQQSLLRSLESGSGTGAADDVRDGMSAVLVLEEQGRIADALERLQAILAIMPSDPNLQSVLDRLVRARESAEAERERQAAVQRLLGDAASLLDAGSVEAALSAANQVLALDSGNDEALGYISTAYAILSRKLTGSKPAGNIPPAVRFVDLREQQEEGPFAQFTRSANFRLDGIVIDESPIAIQVLGSDEHPLDVKYDSQPLGDFHVGEFHMETQLAPGTTSFSLLATDADGITSRSEYSVVYLRPFFRAPWFYGLLLALSTIFLAGVLWRRYQHSIALRQRLFNPYVAGAPILDDDMFFGRRELVDRILQTIHNNSLLIFGERRIGKTSIQYQIKKRLCQLDDPEFAFYPVYVDLQGTPQSRFFQTIAEDIFQQLSPVTADLGSTVDISGEYDFRDFVRDVRNVLKTLQQQTHKTIKLVLLIDEVDELNDYDPRINQKLRSLFMKSFAENLVAVVSGVEIKKRWEREGSPWYNFFEEIEVRPFTLAEARELIERPIGRMFRLDKGVVDLIFQASTGRPYLIQKICIGLVSRLHEQRRRKITVDDVRAVARSSAVAASQVHVGADREWAATKS